jgi:hypothetical protein
MCTVPVGGDRERLQSRISESRRGVWAGLGAGPYWVGVGRVRAQSMAVGHEAICRVGVPVFSGDHLGPQLP